MSLGIPFIGAHDAGHLSVPLRSSPASADSQGTPWPVKEGGVWSFLYSYSLGIALLVLFATSFLLHWFHSVAAANEEALMHGEPTYGAIAYLAQPQLWFESFQNWQSEFLSTAVLVVLSIVLRHRGSPESKPVAEPQSKTGH